MAHLHPEPYPGFVSEPGESSAVYAERAEDLLADIPEDHIWHVQVGQGYARYFVPDWDAPLVVQHIPYPDSGSALKAPSIVILNASKKSIERDNALYRTFEAIAQKQLACAMQSVNLAQAATINARDYRPGNFDKAQMRELRADLTQALTAWAQARGLSVNVGNIKFGPSHADIKLALVKDLALVTTGSVPMKPVAASTPLPAAHRWTRGWNSLNRWASGLPDNALGRTVKVLDKPHIIIGWSDHAKNGHNVMLGTVRQNGMFDPNKFYYVTASPQAVQAALGS